MFKLLFILVLIGLVKLSKSQEGTCYDYNNRPVRCYPEFINAVFNRPVEVTNTCGEAESEYCVQTNIHGLDYMDSRYGKCDICNNQRRDKSHPPEYLTDYNSPSNLTWWQSDTMEYNIQYPNSVNLTLHLGKSFDITYIQVKFHSSRPESFAIYKKTDETSDWIPYQFYSANCEDIYNKKTREIITKENEVVAICTDEFSDIAPLSGGSVAFSTLEGRPNAYNFENSEELKEWVTATDIRITLNRLNTFGDEVFGDPKVLRSYFYAISDISVGGRCKCNGHADKCVSYQDQDFEEKYKCDCKHNTDGVDCEKCLPFYNDRPWAPATFTNANECVPCNCNGLSNKCVFNQTLYDLTGHGGYCIDCERNTDGAHCENCKFGFYRREFDNECIDCQCHKEGSYSSQCDPSGKCKCKPGVTGDKCDRCLPNHYDLSANGCKLCNCYQAGSFDSPPVCDQRDGKCRCKQNVEGQNCDKCKPGYFNLDQNSTLGCLQCFCFAHSSECKSSMNHYTVDLETNLIEWTATDSNGNSFYIGTDQSNEGIFVNTQEKDVWFNAPSKFLGNQRNSYNQDLTFRLKYNQGKTSMSKKDLVLENLNNGLQIYKTLYEPNSLTDPLEPIDQEFQFKLKETEGWRPVLASRDFQRLLTNLTSIRIKSNLGGYTFLKSFTLKTAQKIPNPGEQTPARWIEQCQCPPSHAGQFCESCQNGFKRESAFGDSFSKCIPCECNNHSITCDQQSGKCNCMHNTQGDNCESCKDGYYGNALLGTANDCKICPCPNNGPCAEFYNYQSQSNEVVCLNCPLGTRGNLCDMCDDGYYEVTNSDGFKCEKCKCNSNIDENAVGNCDQSSGKCLRCIYNTTGFECEKCLPSYWGNALTDVKCHACECYELGSETNECDLTNGQCMCKKNVVGRTCDKCGENYWNLESGEGCQECKCNPLGSVSLSCDQLTGRCECRPGVTGLKCDQCLPNYFGFSAEGCKHCECDSFGSISQQCDETGKCKCQENISGLKCNQCTENYYNFTSGCLKCDDCYNLVQNLVNDLRKNLTQIEKSLIEIIPQTETEESKLQNQQLKTKLDQVKSQVNELHENLFNNKQLKPSYKESVKHLEDLITNLNSDFKKLQKPHDQLELNVKKLSNLEQAFNKSYADIGLQLTMVSIFYQQHQSHLENFLKEREESETTHIDPNSAKLKDLSRLSRETAHEQEQLSKNYSTTIHSYIKFSSDSIQDINDLLNSLERIQTGSEIDYSLLSETATHLEKHAEEIKSDLNKYLNNLSKLKAKLDQFKISENDFDQEAKQSNSYVSNLNQKLEESKENLENLKNKLSVISESAESDLIKAREQLNKAKIKDNDLQQLLNRSKLAKQRAEQAFEVSKQAFNNASSILSALEDFDNLYKNNKEKADKAANLEPEIEESLEQAEKISSNINENLKNNLNTILNAQNLVNGLKNSLEESNRNLEHVYNKSSELANKSSDLSKYVDGLKGEHEDWFESIESTLNKHNNLPIRLDSLKQSADKMVDNSQTLLNSITNAEEDLKSFENLDLSFNDLSENVLKNLKEKFDGVVRQLDSFKYLDYQLNNLQERYEKSNDELKFYEREVPILKQHVLDLEKIKKSMCLA